MFAAVHASAGVLSLCESRPAERASCMVDVFAAFYSSRMRGNLTSKITTSYEGSSADDHSPSMI